mmetsp:Transcript_11425/g.21108  ORF Transcript_11425/g.21108 Transcript_11425/m.21108 type:complete len:463 (-) Transcript_11425:94-1482(-)|eukprot:CAMPEP_0201910822 /NCGR_PEP_ID=MMETSP0903-20130614/2044_1 /ASSEMBLY_ACC=CAM_ASM_000552 /TAXON_ID=420261 /ORGANISM="Thalassiosira antarctica, Strain CCMP982" /LENGTH=462 /DNA_ID=CAMNT_0048445499 /DNA_START=139 /DNA_END=1527 /DNA_ORIENTATION=-
MKLVTPLLVIGISSTADAFTLRTTTTSTRSAVTQLNAEKKRVVVTGLGVISGCGIGHESFFQNCIDGVSSLGTITRFDPTHYPCQIGSEVPADMFNPVDHFVNPKNAKSNDRFTHFAVAAARLALKDAKLGDTPETLENAEKCGVFVGTAFGGMETFEREVLKLHKKPERPKVSPFTIPALLGNTASGVIGIECGCKGPNYGITSACASASHAIGEAFGMIADGNADQMVAGGTEASITPLSYAGFSSMKAMTTKYNDNPKAGSRPFDADRGGFVMGEGAGVVVLESLESALARGAHVYCEIVGYGATCDAHHITTPAPEGRGLAAAMEMAIKQSGMEKTDINYVNAHGTSTAYNDKFETMAFKAVFGEHATKKDGKFTVSSTKCVTGHTLGAAGGMEAVIAARAIQDGVVPPTINYETPDPDCDLDYVPNVKREMEVDGAMSTNLGFGGHNAALLFRKYTE